MLFRSRKSIKNLYKNETEGNRKTKNFDTATINSKDPLKWINVSTEIINLGYDTLVKDWAYKIKYIIQSYEAPVVNITQAGVLPKYYGPSKRYEYWLTGKNTEVSKFELNYNSAYTQIAISNLTDQLNLLSPIPTIVGQRTPEQRQGQIGAEALESQNTYVNYLNDPGAYSSAHITIMGDPDWLLQDNSSSINELFDQYYGTNGYTINCNNG